MSDRTVLDDDGLTWWSRLDETLVCVECGAEVGDEHLPLCNVPRLLHGEEEE